MASNQNICHDVITIPQTDNLGTCWFNAVLMSILYSQYSRNLLLTNNNLDKKKDKISKILNQLLKHNYIKYEMHEDYPLNEAVQYLNTVGREVLFKKKL